MIARNNWFAAWALAFVVVAAIASGAWAHYNLNVNIRIIHVDRQDDGLRVRLRIPMAYLVADKLGPEQADGTRDAAPFTTNRTEDEALVHYLDAAALRADPGGLGALIADGHQIRVGDALLQPEFLRLRAYPALKQPPFAKLTEAIEALKGPIYAPEFDVTYVGDTVIDAELFYPTKDVAQTYSLQSTLNPGLPAQEETANLILDHFGSDVLVFRIRGLLAEPVEIGRSSLQAFVTFTQEGVRHILAGLDHVMFVFCLVLGASTLGALLWRVTGFTLGHSITLTLGFFGYSPQGPWFVPFIETTIALSIIYAAYAATSLRQGASSILVTTLIGLLHGLGFSFVLSSMLKSDAPDIWQSLLAFNVGVEVGQIGIVLVSWVFLAAIARMLPEKLTMVRTGLAFACIAVASIWVGQRSLQLLASL